MKVIGVIRIIKDTKALKTYEGIVVLEVGDTCVIDNQVKQEVSLLFSSKVRVNPSTAKNLLNGGYAELVVEGNNNGEGT